MFPVQVVPIQQQEDYRGMMRLFEEYSEKVKELEPDACLVILSMRIRDPFPLDDVVVPFHLTRALSKGRCKRVLLHLTALGGDLMASNVFKEIFESMQIQVDVVAPIRLGATASLASFIIYNKLYVNSFTIIDPFNLKINIGPALSTLDVPSFISAMDFIMRSGGGKEIEEALKTQAYGLLVSQGVLFSYVEANRQIRYVEELIREYISHKLLISEDEFKDLFVGSEEKVAKSISGKKLKNILSNVVLMDEEYVELSKASTRAEENLQEEMEKGGIKGVILAEGFLQPLI